MRRRREIGVAVAAFYPSVQLNGAVGLDSLDPSKICCKARSLQYNVGPSVTPADFRRRPAAEHAGTARGAAAGSRDHLSQDGAAAPGMTSSTRWSRYRLEQTRRARLAAQVSTTPRRPLGIARARYRDGVTEFLNVLDAERTGLQAEQQQAQSTTNVGARSGAAVQGARRRVGADFPAAEAAATAIMAVAPKN